MKKILLISILVIFTACSFFSLSASYFSIKNHYDIRCKEFNSFFEIYSIVPQPMCYIEEYDVYIPLEVLDKRKDSIHIPIDKYNDKKT